MSEEIEISQKQIESRIFNIRGVQVMLDRDLAELYGVETKMLNRAVKRNKERFPDNFMFQLNESEFDYLRFQLGTSNNSRDDNTLTILSKKEKNIKVTLLTKTISKQLVLDVKKANEQYGNFEIREFGKSHDRFLIIDDTEIYHLGASLKDLGKKWFAFSKMELPILEVLENM